ncbi:hypothetical protein [Embleya sp. NBC_00888]|uniref:ATP dependent DNA ligase n=1 Tax=Embleya sp. NBC_00888 TaxID=2975960 RepID=UPI0038640DD4
MIVAGWVPGTGRLRDTVGALLVGEQAGGELRYLGKVGTGFDDHARAPPRTTTANNHRQSGNAARTGSVTAINLANSPAVSRRPEPSNARPGPGRVPVRAAGSGAGWPVRGGRGPSSGAPARRRRRTPDRRFLPGERLHRERARPLPLARHHATPRPAACAA